jgi:hypothetical protein
LDVRFKDYPNRVLMVGFVRQEPTYLATGYVGVATTPNRTAFGQFAPMAVVRACFDID